MDWQPLAVVPMPPRGLLLHGCWLEAERVEQVALGLEALRMVLNQSFHVHMIGVTVQIRHCSALLWDLARLDGQHRSRVPIVANHFNALRPCLSKTLQDITAYCDNNTITREVRWRKMYHEMKEQAGGISLRQRFILYNDFLSLLLCLLTHDKRFDWGQLEMLWDKIIDIYQPRVRPAQAQLPTATNELIGRQDQVVVVPPPREKAHWCERVFAARLSSRTELAGSGERSRVAKPLAPVWDPNRPKGRTVMRRPFDGDRICVRFILDAEDAPHVEVRVHGPTSPWYAWKDLHDVWCLREGDALVMRTWSRPKGACKDWAVLHFITWEELVLFYCAFTALRRRSPVVPSTNNVDYTLEGENLRFQAQIIDDDYRHSLLVYKDLRTGGLRLHAAVYDGELRQCPVWTAFVTHLSASPSWLVRVSKQMFHVRDIQLYVFCQKYRESRMRRNRLGAFEIYFVHMIAADNFEDLFATHAAAPEPSDVEQGRIADASSA